MRFILPLQSTRFLIYESDPVVDKALKASPFETCHWHKDDCLRLCQSQQVP